MRQSHHSCYESNLFQSFYSPLNWKLTNEPYQGIKNKNFKPLKKSYGSANDYKKVILNNNFIINFIFLFNIINIIIIHET